MILPEYKALFVHVPKAAGQSVENFLLSSLGKNRKEHGAQYLLRPNEDPQLGPPRLAHLTASEYVKYHYLSQEEFNQCTKFAVIRNPWGRMLSFYKFRGFNSLVSFDIFVRKYLERYFEEEHWFFRPQTDYIYNDNDTLLVDHVINMEQLNHGFDVVAKKMDVVFETMPKNNPSEKRGVISKKSFNVIKKHPEIIFPMFLGVRTFQNYKEAYSSEALKIVEKLYQRDLDLLGYTY